MINVRLSSHFHINKIDEKRRICYYIIIKQMIYHVNYFIIFLYKGELLNETFFKL